MGGSQVPCRFGSQLAKPLSGDLVAGGRVRSKREKLIEREKHGPVCMHGELEGIMGSWIPAPPPLITPHAL